MQIKENLFDLTKEQIETSKMIYEGKIVKCLIAPYHTYAQLEKIIPFTKTTYLFPERELNANQVRGLLSMIVKSPLKGEFLIITASQSVILDMADDCVRILTEGGDVVPCPIKTFMANIHSIKYEIFDNEAYRLSKETKSQGVKDINILIDKINSAKSKVLSKKERDALVTKVSLIGEPLIANKLLEMIGDIRVK